MADKGGAAAAEEKRASVIQIKVVHAKNLRGVKGDSVTAYAKVEFGKSLGETNKAEVGGDGITKFNFSANIEVNLDDPMSIDEISHKLVLFSVIEVLPKEKKAREEKTAPIGQGVLDLSQLLRGEDSFTTLVLIHAGTTAENIAANTGQNIAQPELLVEVSASKPLIASEVFECSNYMTIRVDSLYSLPDSWQPSNNVTHNYNAVMSVPLSDTVDTQVGAGNGSIKPPPEKNMDIAGKGAKPVQRRYVSANGLTGNVVFIPSTTVDGYEYEDEDGDIRAKEHRNFRREAEGDKSRVTWNSERNVFLMASATSTLQERIAKCRCWPMEIYRSSMSSGGKKGKEDDTSISYHGIAWVNLAPLLYPGVTRVKGAALVHPYIESEVLERTKKAVRTGTQSGDDGTQARVSSGGSRRGVSSAKKGKDSKKASTKDAAVDGAETEQKNQEAQVYTEAKSYVVVEIFLEKPLVPKRPPEELAAKVAEYIPTRTNFTKHSCGADEAVSDYHKQIGEVANLVLNEYRQKFGASNDSATNEVMDERKRSLIFDLNSSGKYFAFKEQLKQSVVKIVREKFFKTSAFENNEELHQFLSELYVFLVEQMHKGVSKVFSLQNSTAPLPSPLTEHSLIHFAKEAELNQNYELAARYYQERLAMDQNNSASWFDYGSFSLLVGNVSKAGECFRECLALDQRHILGLIMYGVVCFMEERYDVAETFFEDATCVENENYLAWTVLGLLYDSRDNDIGAEMAFIEANKHFGSEESEESEESSIFLACADRLLALHAYSLVESALSHELLSSPKSLNQDYYLLLAKLHMAKGELMEAECYVKQATVLDHTNPAAWALLGHILYLGGESKSAREHYERTLSYETPAPDTHSIRLRLASIYLQLQQYKAAKDMFLLACRDSPSCITWLGVGISCYRLGELNEAEEALSEANILNNTDPEVWGYLSLVCLKTTRKLESEQSYKYALKVGLKDPDLLEEIKTVQTDVGFGDAGF